MLGLGGLGEHTSFFHKKLLFFPDNLHFVLQDIDVVIEEAKKVRQLLQKVPVHVECRIRSNVFIC